MYRREGWEGRYRIKKGLKRSEGKDGTFLDGNIVGKHIENLFTDNGEQHCWDTRDHC